MLLFEVIKSLTHARRYSLLLNFSTYSNLVDGVSTNWYLSWFAPLVLVSCAPWHTPTGSSHPAWCVWCELTAKHLTFAGIYRPVSCSQRQQDAPSTLCWSSTLEEKWNWEIGNSRCVPGTNHWTPYVGWHKHSHTQIKSGIDKNRQLWGMCSQVFRRSRRIRKAGSSASYDTVRLYGDNSRLFLFTCTMFYCLHFVICFLPLYFLAYL